MNNTFRTLLVGTVLGLMATALYVVIPGETAILNVAYAAVLVALVVMVLSTLHLTRGEMHLPQDAVFPIDAWTYFGTNLLLTAIAIGLDISGVWSVPWPIFSVAHTLLLGFFVIRILAFSAGKEHIDRVEEIVTAKVTDWRLLLADLDAIKNRLPAPLPSREQAVKELQTVYEAFRSSDPMSKPALSDLDLALKEEIAELGVAVDGGRADDISAHCANLLRRLKDRNTRVKAFK